MSWGYVPKKLKRARRERLLRKKYKNFSCKTCRYAYICMKGVGKNVEFCPSWRPSYEAKKGKNVTTCSAQNEKKKKSNRFLKNLFK